MAGEDENSGKDLTKLRLLISEVRKPGRECLYDFRNSYYKNNMVKQVIWDEIAETLNMPKIAAQHFWKSTRQKYKVALFKSKNKSENQLKNLKPHVKFFLADMEFMRKFIEEQEPTSTLSATTSSGIASSPPVKRKYSDELAFENSCKQLQEYAEAIRKADEDMDPFFISLYNDVKIFPPLKQQELKITFMKAVYNAHLEQQEKQ